MHEAVIKMNEALDLLRRGILPEYRVLEIIGSAVIEIKNAVLDLQLKQCGTCSWKMIHADTFSAMTIEDLVFAQSELNKEISKRVKIMFIKGGNDERI